MPVVVVVVVLLLLPPPLLLPLLLLVAMLLWVLPPTSLMLPCNTSLNLQLPLQQPTTRFCIFHPYRTTPSTPSHPRSILTSSSGYRCPPHPTRRR
jgi:hypothetical protein